MGVRVEVLVAVPRGVPRAEPKPRRADKGRLSRAEPGRKSMMWLGILTPNMRAQSELVQTTCAIEPLGGSLTS